MLQFFYPRKTNFEKISDLFFRIRLTDESFDEKNTLSPHLFQFLADVSSQVHVLARDGPNGHDISLEETDASVGSLETQVHAEVEVGVGLGLRLANVAVAVVVVAAAARSAQRHQQRLSLDDVADVRRRLLVVVLTNEFHFSDVHPPQKTGQFVFVSIVPEGTRKKIKTTVNSEWIGTDGWAYRARSSTGTGLIFKDLLTLIRDQWPRSVPRPRRYRWRRCANPVGCVVRRSFCP